MSTPTSRWPNLIFTAESRQRLREVSEFLDGLTETRPEIAADVREEFHQQMDYLNDYGGRVSDIDPRRRFIVTLGRDWSSLSFSIVWKQLVRKTGTYRYAFNGGLIWHGGTSDPLAITQVARWWGVHT